jgi:hypothetical protein
MGGNPLENAVLYITHHFLYVNYYDFYVIFQAFKYIGTAGRTSALVRHGSRRFILPCCLPFSHHDTGGSMRTLIMLLIGVPLPLILLYWIFF